jgi:hypothetical protein
MVMVPAEKAGPGTMRPATATFMVIEPSAVTQLRETSDINAW